MHLQTIRGYDFYEVASALQKTIRRGDTKLAGYFALELFSSNYDKYLWKRMLTISAEDCWGILTKEIESLYNSYSLVREKIKNKDNKGRIFISKAIILLCEAKKSRDADHLQNFIYDKKIQISDDEIINELSTKYDGERVEMPDYVFDCHTMQGKRRGKTKEDFFKDEYNALENKEKGLFDTLVE